MALDKSQLPKMQRLLENMHFNANILPQQGHLTHLCLFLRGVPLCLEVTARREGHLTHLSVKSLVPLRLSVSARREDILHTYVGSLVVV